MIEAKPKEEFSISKAARSFVSGLDWFKTCMIAIRIAILLFVLGVPPLCYQIGKRAGISQGFASGYQQAIKDNPPQVYNAPATVNNNPTPKPVSKAGITAFGWTLGVCHL